VGPGVTSSVKLAGPARHHAAICCRSGLFSILATLCCCQPVVRAAAWRRASLISGKRESSGSHKPANRWLCACHCHDRRGRRSSHTDRRQHCWAVASCMGSNAWPAGRHAGHLHRAPRRQQARGWPGVHAARISAPVCACVRIYSPSLQAPGPLSCAHGGAHAEAACSRHRGGRCRRCRPQPHSGPPRTHAAIHVCINRLAPCLNSLLCLACRTLGHTPTAGGANAAGGGPSRPRCKATPSGSGGPSPWSPWRRRSPGR
jgi:hypothetical protein